MVGRSSEATFADAFEKQEAILRYLGGLDPTGEVNLSAHHFYVLLVFYSFTCKQL